MIYFLKLPLVPNIALTKSSANEVKFGVITS